MSKPDDLKASSQKNPTVKQGDVVSFTLVTWVPDPQTAKLKKATVQCAAIVAQVCDLSVNLCVFQPCGSPMSLMNVTQGPGQNQYQR